MVMLYKGKRNKYCKNYRGVRLLSKTYDKIVTDCDKRIKEPVANEEQGRFRKGGCAAKIFLLRKVQEKKEECICSIYG